MDRQLNCSECGENYETGCNCEAPTTSEVGCSVLLAPINDLLEQWRSRHKTATAMIKRARDKGDKVSERRLIAKSSTISSMVHELEREIRNNLS